MKKILFLIDTLTGGGAEKVLRTLVNHMDQTQFDITVQTVFPENQLERLLVPGINYKSMYPKNSTFYNKMYRLEAALGWAYNLRIKNDYDIEVAFLEFAPTKLIAQSNNKQAVKLAWIHCELDKALPDPIGLVSKTKKWYQSYDKIVCVSSEIKDIYNRLYGDFPATEVVQNVIDCSEIGKKAEMNINLVKKKDRKTLAFIGRLTPQKNIPRLLRVHKRLLSEGIEHDLWIVGDGDLRPEIERMIGEEALQDTVTLFGFQDNPYPFMKAADILVCSSNYEGFSTFITEGLILEKPIVTTDCSGMRDLLGDSEFGIVTENSDEGFYGGLKRMLDEPGLQEYYAGKAQVRGKDFRLEKLVKDNENFLLETYKEKFR